MDSSKEEPFADRSIIYVSMQNVNSNRLHLKEVIRMVSWWSIPVALLAGIVLGIIIVALISANEDE